MGYKWMNFGAIWNFRIEINTDGVIYDWNWVTVGTTGGQFIGNYIIVL